MTIFSFQINDCDIFLLLFVDVKIITWDNDICLYYELVFDGNKTCGLDLHFVESDQGFRIEFDDGVLLGSAEVEEVVEIVVQKDIVSENVRHDESLGAVLV